MKKNKLILILVPIICILLILAAYLYTYKFSDYTYYSGWEFHIYPEEYDENYSEHIKTITLEKNTDYQIKIDATCETGTMELTVYSVSEGYKHYTVDINNPYSEVIEISKNTTNEVKITVKYNADTKGVLLGEVFVHKHYFFL